MTTPPDTRVLVGDLVRDVREIVRLEIQLAKTELKESVIPARQAAIFGALALCFAIPALIILPLAAVWALDLVLPLWAAGLIVGAVLALLAGAFAVTARQRMQLVTLTPQRTIDTLQGIKEERWTT
jgi:uncharacterized membrane protein YqjE